MVEALRFLADDLGVELHANETVAARLAAGKAPMPPMRKATSPAPSILPKR
jgi:hypothetical protein